VDLLEYFGSGFEAVAQLTYLTNAEAFAVSHRIWFLLKANYLR
jgi:hypothetical protein